MGGNQPHTKLQSVARILTLNIRGGQDRRPGDRYECSYVDRLPFNDFLIFLVGSTTNTRIHYSTSSSGRFERHNTLGIRRTSGITQLSTGTTSDGV